MFTLLFDLLIRVCWFCLADGGVCLLVVGLTLVIFACWRGLVLSVVYLV